MAWILVHTRPRQEQVAHEHLQRQGYDVCLPLLTTEKLQQGKVTLAREPLFPRYLFVRLGSDPSDRSWAPIRSTRGVSRIVTFGSRPAQVDDALVASLQARSILQDHHPQRLFDQGDVVTINRGPFSGIDAVYQMTDGEQRALVLIELLCKPTLLRISPAHLTRVG